jgi:membrane protein YdbS with pleckstrin-like domain
MIRALLHSTDHLISSDGAWWILALDSILLIPVVFAVFFYPRPVLIGVGVAVVLTIAAVVLMRVVHAHQHRHP